MYKNYRILFIPALMFITMLNPACKHGTNDGIELYRRYAVKNITVVKRVQKVLHHD